jgi:hypothetical protein
MKLKHIFLLAAAIITCVAACSSVDSALTVRRTAAGPFTALRSSGPLPVEIRQVPDSAGTVVIEASDRALAHVHVANSDGTLIIDWQRAGNVRDYSREVKSIKVYCGTELRQITQTGSGIVNLPALHTQSELTLVNTGSGAIRMGRTDCLNFTGSNTGSGLIKIASLKARNISTSATGSGMLQLDTVEANSFNCTLTGSGMAQVGGHASKASLALRGSGMLSAGNLKSSSLSLSVTGSGMLKYDSAASAVKIISGHTNGSGTLIR